MIAMTTGVLTLMESGIGPRVGLHVEGLTQTCMQDQSYIDNIKEISLEMDDYIYVSPWRRLALSTAQIAFGLHSVNKQRIDAAQARYNEMVAQSAQQQESGMTPVNNTDEDDDDDL